MLLLGGMTGIQAGMVTSNSGRGLVALPAQSQGMFVSWRLLPGDDANTTFDLLRNGEVIASDILRATSYNDILGTADSKYAVVVKQNGETVETTSEVTPWGQLYMTLKLDRPATAKTPSGASYTYEPSDCAIADADGDGEFEILLKWRPSGAFHKDNGAPQGDGYTGIVLLDCYKLNGEKLWRIDLGKNIRSGEHYTQILFYDLNGDGKAEMVCKTAQGSKDGTGAYVTEVADDETIKALDNSEDLRNRSNGRILKGAELLTVFEGATGKAIHTVWYNPNRAGEMNCISDYPEQSFWGDDYANRSERYLACVAYLDGQDKNPSAIFTRGYYTRAYLWAVDFDGSKLTTRWLSASTSKKDLTLYKADGTSETREYLTNTDGRPLEGEKGVATEGNTCFGEGSHNLSVGDVDGDGKDEILFGSAALDDDGWMLWSTGFGHGDALHLADHDPDRPGLEFFMVHEEPPYGYHFIDAATGEIIFKATSADDNGMGTMADLDLSLRGSEFWTAAAKALYGIDGNKIASLAEHKAHKFNVYWDGDLAEELYYRATIDKWNGKGNFDHVIQFGNYGNSSATNEGPNACLIGDFLGDWREEVILFDASDNSTLNIFTTNIPTEYRVPWLMSDHIYEMGIVWQNIGYNMPAHLSYYLPDYVEANQPKDNTTTTEYNFVGVGAGNTVTQTTWGDAVTVDGLSLKYIGSADNNYDNRFAGETNAKDDTWRFRDVSNVYQGLWAQGGNVKLAILDVKSGDEITFNICKGGSLSFDNPALVGGLESLSEGETPLTVREAGNLLMTAGAGTYLRSITIRTSGETTAIRNIARSQSGDGAYYNLAGQRVTTLTKGIYIHNGRKIIIR